MKQKNKSGKSKKILKTTFITLATIAVMLICIFVIWLTTGVDFGMVDTVKNITLKINTTVYSTNADGKDEVYEQIIASENRVWVSIDDIPQEMQNAIVAIEDERFYKHKGVDVKRTLGAVWGEFTGGSGYGGSTLTQQLVKNITGDRERTKARKIREIFRALELEKTLDKSEILELYLNTVYFGQGCYGVETASNKYFGKSIKELDLAECASIAGITQYPTLYEPLGNPEENKKKQHLVLDKMEELGFITDVEHDEAYDEELVFTENNVDTTNTQNSYFVEKVINDVITDLTEKAGYNKSIATQMVYGGGLKIYSTVDAKVQKAMEEVFENEASFPKTSGDVKPESAMVITDPYTGEVKGIVGGRGKKSGSMVLNRATQSPRQPGSSIKPLSVYGPGIDTGKVTQYTVIKDEPININGWTPKNYDGTFEGSMTVMRALQKSQNIPAINILQMVGVDRSYEYLTQKMHFTTLDENDRNLAALALGGMTRGVTVYEMAAAYSVFPNKGVYNKPKTYTKVTDSTGKVILEASNSSNVVFSENSAYTMRNLLKNAVENGTGGGSKISGMDTAGKTGTTDKDSDRWFAAFTPYYCGVVWFGYDVPQKIVVSGNPALKLWKAVMDKVHKGLDPKTFDKPSKSSATALCTQSRKLATGECKVYYEYFSKGSAPTVYCNPSTDHHKKTNENGEGENTENTTQGEGTKIPPPDANAPGGGQTANPPSQGTGGSNGQNPPSQPSTPPSNQPTVNLD